MLSHIRIEAMFHREKPAKCRTPLLVWPDVCLTPVRGGLRGQRVGNLRVDDLLSVGVAVVEPVGSKAVRSKIVGSRDP